MSWMQKLYETAQSIEILNLDESARPWPVAHMAKKAHVEVVLNHEGKLREIRTLSYNEAVTIVPTTEASGNRTSTIEPHPLCEELSYCAKDLPGRDPQRYEKMKSLMKGWLNSDFQHPKVRAVYAYLEEGSIFSDLDKMGLFPFATVNYKGVKTKVEPKKVFIRWRIEEPGSLCTGTWEDASLIDSWIAYDASINEKNGFCMLSGRPARLAKNHSRFLRASDDGAKLISSNDTGGYTYRGRFTDGKKDSGRQCCTVGYIESQKAHNALRWLIARQGYRKINNELGAAFVAWAVSCKGIPDPVANSLEFLGEPNGLEEPGSFTTDIGQAFALRLRRRIAGYQASIDDAEDIIVIGLDSATPGRMAVMFYRELTGSEFLNRIERWHGDFSWTQNYGKDSCFVGAPSPKEIAWTAFGGKVEGKNGMKLLNATVERLLPCILDGVPLPRDLVISAVRRASNRNSLGKWEWEKCLGIACSLCKGINRERSYQMELEEGRTTRDYLYGCLLAVAERIESMALYFAKEQRDTTAARLMQRFADHPYSTWRTIETALAPYKARIQAKAPGLLEGYKELLDEIHAKFVCDEYTNDSRLSGEYLLGYHCQRTWLREHRREKGLWVPKELAEPENQETDIEE